MDEKIQNFKMIYTINIFSSFN